MGLFGKKDPTKKLKKKHEALLKEAMELQRSGDIQGYARKMDEAQQLDTEIQKMKTS